MNLCYKIEDCSVKIVYVFILGPPRSESAFKAENCSGIHAGAPVFIVCLMAVAIPNSDMVSANKC